MSTFQSRPTAAVSWRRRAFALIALVLVLGIAYGVSHGRHHSSPRAARPATHASARASSPATLVASVSARLPAAVQDPAAAADASGNMLLIGGLSAADTSVATIEKTNGATTHPAGSLPAPLHDAAAASIAGQVYFFGGGDTGSSDQILRVSSATVVGRLPVAASDVGAAAIGDTAYIVGGYTGQTPLATIVAWRPGSAARVVAHMPQALRYAAVAAADGKLVIAGGTTTAGASRDVYSFDPATGAVRRIAQLPRPLTHAAAAALGANVYVIGGRGSDLSTQTDQILAIDATSGAIRPAGRLPVALSDAGATVAAGRILVVGGRDARGQVHDEIVALSAR